MKRNNVKLGKRILYQMLAISFLAIFLVSSICTEWKQTETFIYASSEENRMLACKFDEHRDNMRNSQNVFLIVSHVENLVLVSKEAGVLSMPQTQQLLVGDIYVNQQMVSRLERISSHRDNLQRKEERAFFASQYLALLLGMCAIYTLKSICIRTVPTHAQRITLSYIQRQDGKKGLFV